MGDDLKKRAMALAREMKKLLEENLLKDPKIFAETLDRIFEIKKEINSMGLMITWDFKLNLETSEPEVEVQLLTPRKDMTEEEQKTYDEWFARINNIKPPE